MKNILLIILLFINIKLIAQPSCQWAYIPIGSSQTYNSVFYVSVDHSGNLFQVGKILGKADMDPAPGPADTSFSFVSYNYYLSKTDINGHLLWIKYFQTNSQIAFFEFKGLKLNSADEIVVIGNFYGMVDFDLSSSGVDTLRSHFQTYPDYFVAKYNSSGDYQWAFNIGDPTTSTIESQALSILPNDNIVISANPNGTLDVDPDVAVHNSIGGNANIICYDSNGNYLWNNNITTQYSYGITTNSLDCDINGNTYLLTVGYYELTVNKFDNTGMRIWDYTIGDFSSNARVDPQSVLVDKATGDYYIAGTFGGTVDFDPGVAVVTKNSSSGFFQDGFIAKYDQNMNLIWINAYVGEVSFGNSSLDFDNSEIIAVGSVNGTVDFGNGVILSSSSTASPLYLKINSSGITQDGFALNEQGKFYTVNTGANHSFVTSGYITTTTDMDPSSGTLILNTSTSQFFNAVYQTSGSTSMNEINESETIMAYPNPSSGNINLKVTEKLVGTDYLLSDFTNKTVATGKFTGEYTMLELNNLSDGIYILRAGENIKYKLNIIKQ